MPTMTADPSKVFAAYEERLRRRKVSDAALRDYRIVTTRFMEWLREHGMDMEEVKLHHVEDFFADSGWSARTQRGRVTYLRAPWRYAVHRMEVLPRSPFDEGQVELERPPELEPHIISNRELRGIKDGIEAQTDWTLFHLLTFTGARAHELRGLTWDAVSFVDQTLTVMGKGTRQRTIPLHPRLQEALSEQGVFYRGSPWVLPGRAGQMSRNGFWDKTKRMAKGHDVNPHDFRRTFVTSMVTNGAIEAAVKQIVGHSRGGDITYGHYTRLSQTILYREILKVYADDPI